MAFGRAVGRSRGLLAAVLLTTGGVFVPSLSRAAGLNDYSCRATAARPYPVVLAHGRSGHATDMVAITDALVRAGYCVFGEDYGRVGGVGQTGMDHLAVSGAQFGGVVDRVLGATGAKRVSAVGYSEGMGVIANYLLARGGSAKVHRVVSFGGLHHPYAHVGLANVIDGTLFLPNTILAVQKSLPPFTSNVKAKDIAAAALGLASTVGANLSPADREVVESNFVSDLFDPQYWTALHGGLSEAPGNFVAVGTGAHSLPTKDAAPTVCYTNIVSIADPITGVSAGFQDPAPNVDNFTLISTADHGGIISDPGAIAKMLGGLNAPCAVAPVAGGDAGSVPEEPSGPGAPTGRDGGVGGAPGATGLEVNPEDPFAVTPQNEGCGCRTVSAPTGAASPIAAFGILLGGLAFHRRRASRLARRRTQE